MNINTIQDGFNEFPDWFELFNIAGSPFDLSGWYISNDRNNLAKWAIPPVVIDSNSYLLIFASGRDINQVPVYWNTVIDAGEIFEYWIPDSSIDGEWKTPAFNDTSWSQGSSGFGYGDSDDQTEFSELLSCIYVRKDFVIDDLLKLRQLLLHIDYDDGFVAYVNGVEVAKSGLGNSGSVVAYNQFTDIEHEAVMYSGNQPELFDISGYINVLNPGKNTLAIEVHNSSASSSDMTLIPFLTVGKFSSDGVQEHVSSYLKLAGSMPHANFKLKSGGEILLLSDAGGKIIDSLMPVAIPLDCSFGKTYNTGKVYNYFLNPTPGSQNDSVGLSLLVDDTVIFSHQGGYFTGSFQIGIETLSDFPVYYTIDGTDPDMGSPVFEENIDIVSNTVLKSRVIKVGYLPGKIYARTFFSDHNPTLPILCMSTEPDNLWDYNTGMYVMGPYAESPNPHYGANFWMDWEKPMYVEIYGTDGNSLISQQSGAKIFGAWSRIREQKSFALFARKSYGEEEFNQSLFRQKKLSAYKSLVARNAGNDGDAAFIRDVLATDITRHLQIDYQAGQPVASYLNGEYWGIYNLREKVNEDFLEANHGIDAEDINILEGDNEIVEGDNEKYNELLTFLQQKVSLTNTKDYAFVSDIIDIDNFIKYQLVQIYIDNRDWPGNNLKYWNSRLSESKFRWILYDTDFGFGEYSRNSYADNTLDFALEPHGPDRPNPPLSTLLLRRLVTNQGFRNNFINQMADNINTTFLPGNVIHYVDSLKSLYKEEMVYHKNRWGQSYGSWNYEVDLIKSWSQARPGYMRGFIRSVFDLPAQHSITLSVSNKEHGRIKLNTIQPSDFPFVGIYFQDVPVHIEAIPSTGFKFVRWEGEDTSTNRIISYNPGKNASFKAVFEPATEEDIQIIINEINYNSSPEYSISDWVEFYNHGNSTVDLTGFLFSDSTPDSGFAFPSGIIMAPGDYLVVSKKVKKFNEFKPEVAPVIGDIAFGLSSGGDELRLYDNNGHVLDAVDYLAYAPWPTGANGLGPTLELKSPDLDNGQPQNWKADFFGGTPGKRNSGLSSVQGNLMQQGTKLKVFPSHFRDYATIEFQIVRNGFVQLDLVDLQGRSICVLRSGYLAPGFYTDNLSPGSQMNSGVYILRLRTDDYQIVKKIIYTK